MYLSAYLKTFKLLSWLQVTL